LCDFLKLENHVVDHSFYTDLSGMISET
jgi:hypothetical protein